MVKFIRSLGLWGLSTFQRLGGSCLFLMKLLLSSSVLILRPFLVATQMYSVGVLTLSIIIVSGIFVGMVLGLQGYTTLTKFGAEQSLGAMVSLTLVRELGPVISALLFAGRAGSALTAEIGLMKATEQLSALEMMAVDPMRQVIAPRFLAGCFSMPLLTALFIAIGVIGGYFVGVGLLGVDQGAFWTHMQDSTDWRGDVLNGVVKSIVFGFVLSWIAVFEGYDSIPTSEGVSQATTRTVVYSAFSILALDFLLTALMFGI
ncbi:lipid asymmetry maintenance ABC transporter permease subunit MlaE [Candidatus Nitrosacidococcus tergens]|uniref:Intermembrane phospholipid transport system permease protein MlaE n=1 Tax=Candidatus Nitrosacidococcus tergens TaxID=553981 RepID=A0A7G1QB96_9GAMM|nr:lipid asymmetry maintenance ABC transporter permease subunit MlaE [Candidatus Nitrosacidococcus tergens]CAB1277247.1 toluene transporter subunit: membrane component of ABC superfamily [Candidatus Nitrosacidococcus tergens]